MCKLVCASWPSSTWVARIHVQHIKDVAEVEAHGGHCQQHLTRLEGGLGSQQIKGLCRQVGKAAAWLGCDLSRETAVHRTIVQAGWLEPPAFQLIL